MNALTVLHLTECNYQCSTKPQDLKFLSSMKSSMYLNQALIVNSNFCYKIVTLFQYAFALALANKEQLH